jgi:two-component system, NtrC family, sensor kinase
MNEQRSTTILVIDDEEAARYGIGKSLEREGCQVEVASDGREALRKIRELQPHTIISDINMPEMDGISLLQEVKRLTNPPPVVLITAHGSEALAIQALRAGAYDYLSKPFDIEELRLVVRNALERQRLSEENQRYYLQLAATVQELKQTQAERIQAEKRASLGRLVAGFAHEANTPLGALSSVIQTFERAAGRIQTLLKAEEHTDLTRGQEIRRLFNVLSESAQVGQNACHRLDSMVKAMRSFANLDHSPLRRMDIRECVEVTLELLKHQLKKDIRVYKEYADVPEIDCFPSDLNQVFMNLLLNGIEAIPSQGEIHIQSWHDTGMVFVRILDTGKGIPPEDIERIFDPGFTTKGLGVGTGMGLPICQKIVERHGGKIQVESEPSKGSVFTVQLPVRLELTTERID